MEKRRNVTFGVFYFRYIVRMFLVMLLSLAGVLAVFVLLVQSGQILPANYVEKQIEAAMQELTDAQEITAELIPSLCEYALFDAQGQVLDATMSAQDQQTAWEIVSKTSDVSTVYFYKVIERAQEVCVLQYRLIPQYRSAYLREHLLPPQTLLSVAALIAVCLSVIASSVSFGRRLKKKMLPLREQVRLIQAQELTQPFACSGIREIDEVSESLELLGSALKESLERQWHAEETKNRQMAALAHDMKTPLTVVRGNAELLEETPLSDEQRLCSGYIVDSALQMQEYLQLLLEVTRSASGKHMDMRQIRTQELLTQIRGQSGRLAGLHQVTLCWESSVRRTTMTGDSEQIVRAVINVVSNAITFSPAQAQVHIYISDENNRLLFRVEDYGKGFDEEGLRHAAESFYKGDDSRSRDQHYGLGLYIAKTVAEAHGGALTLSNAAAHTGAVVELWFGC